MYKETKTYPHFSILIPAYNVESSIIKCLESIEVQDYRKFTCHILDDGSVDSTLALTNDFSKNRENYRVSSQNNQGISVTRNNLLKLAQGDYIIWIDPDDYIEQNYLASAAELMSLYNPDILLFDFFIERKNTNKIFNLPFSPGKLSFDVLLKQLAFDWRFPSQLWNKIYRRDLFREIKFSPDTKILEDYQVQLPLFQNGKTYFYANKAFYHYVQHDKSSIANKKKQNEINQLKVRADRMEAISQIMPSLFNDCLLSWLISYFYSLSLTNRVANSSSEKKEYLKNLDSEFRRVLLLSNSERVSSLNKFLLFINNKKLKPFLLIFIQRAEKVSKLAKRMILKMH